MENAEEILQSLDAFSKLRPKDIPRELEEYLSFVARTGDPVYHWSITKSLFREKLLHVLTEFHDITPGLDLPPCPNVDPFNYDTMKNCLLERIESFSSTPFTVQRICELLTSPRKQYSRIDKYMRAIEKNILVVSTREPGSREPESGDSLEAILNGDGFDMHIEIEMDGNVSPLVAECPVNRNDTSYSIIADNSNNSASADLVTNCQNDVNEQSEHHIELEIEKDQSKEEHNVKEEPSEPQAIPEVNIGQKISELSQPSLDKKIEEQERDEELAIELTPEESVIDPTTINVESSTSVTSHNPILETFIPTNDPEESTDTSETDSNLTEDSVTSELPETPVGAEENPLIASDVESSNDETPFQQAQEAQEPVVEPPQIINAAEITDVNDFQVLKSEDSSINIIENSSEEKPEESCKIDSNMEKLFQIVCETTPVPEEPIVKVDEVEPTIQNVIVAQSEPIVTEPDDSNEPTEIKEEETVLPVQNNELVSEIEAEQMVDIVENDFLSHLKQNENVTESVEQDQIESMDIPESAMEVEDTPVTSEPMDQ